MTEPRQEKLFAFVGIVLILALVIYEVRYGIPS